MPSPHSQLSPAFVISVLIEFVSKSLLCLPPPSLPAQQSIRSCHFPTRKMSPSEPCTPGDRGASPAGTEGFGLAGLCTDPGAGYLFHSVATCHSIISEEQTTRLLLSPCPHFPSHTQNIHRTSYLQLREQERCSSGSATAHTAWGGAVRTGPCRQTDGQMEAAGTPVLLPASRPVQQLSHLLGAPSAHLGAGCWCLLVCEHRPLPPSLEAAPLLSGIWTWGWHCTPMCAARLQSGPRA